MKKLLLISILLIIGCVTKTIEPTATFCIGMTEDEFIRKNLDIEKTNYIGKTDELGGYSTYIGNSGKYKYIGKIKIPHRFQEFTFAFTNDTLEAVYRGRNNFNREIDYSMYPNAKL